MSKTKIIFLATVLTVSLLNAGLAAAVTSTKTQVVSNTINGKVTAIDDNILTVVGAPKNTSYSVDISDAKITKSPSNDTVALSASDIKVNDIVRIMGKVSGTSVTATAVIISMPPSSSTPGIVTSVDGFGFTIDKNVGGKNQPVAYTVNINESTKFIQAGKTVTIDDIKVGDKVVVSGLINQSNNTINAEKVNLVSTPESQKNKQVKEKPINKLDFGASVSNSVMKFFQSVGVFLGNFFKK
jgi:hypothetical protein